MKRNNVHSIDHGANPIKSTDGKIFMEALPIEYKNSGRLLDDAKFIIETSRAVAYRSVNVVLEQRNWLLGKRIAEEELKGADRADYGTYIIDTLAAQLTEEYGAGFDRRSLYMFLQFFKRFPIVDSLSPQSHSWHCSLRGYGLRHRPVFRAAWQRATVCFEIQAVSLKRRGTSPRNRMAVGNLPSRSMRRDLMNKQEFGNIQQD